MIIPIVQVQRAMLWVANKLAKGHTSSKLRCWDLNLKSLTLTSVFLNATSTISSSRTTKVALQGFRCYRSIIKTIATAGITYGVLGCIRYYVKHSTSFHFISRDDSQISCAHVVRKCTHFSLHKNPTHSRTCFSFQELLFFLRESK